MTSFKIDELISLEEMQTALKKAKIPLDFMEWDDETHEKADRVLNKEICKKNALSLLSKLIT